MQLDKDQFLVTYEGSKVKEAKIIATIQEAGYVAKVVANNPAARSASSPMTEESDPPFFKEALARAKRDRKPLVLDFYAEWCVPCQRMSRETLSDPRVKKLLERAIMVKIDADRFPDLAKKFGVAGLPDIRFLTFEGIEKKKLLDYQDPATFAKSLSELLDGSSERRHE